MRFAMSLSFNSLIGPVDVLPAGFQGKRQAPGELVACLLLQGGKLRPTKSCDRSKKTTTNTDLTVALRQQDVRV